MNGLHVCKAGNAPQVGQVKSFVINGDRIKSKPLDQGGQNYTITKVTQSDTYKDAYGNLGYNIEIEPQNGTPQAHAAQQRAAATSSSDDRSNRIERQHSQEMAIRYIALRFPTGVPENMDIKSILRDMIDWFQRDVGRLPAPPQAKAAVPQPEMDEEMMPQGDADDGAEEPF